ncbi:Do family serine endopeptidase [Pseudahrensia aquimaris]|uniref:Probable periplasmic serine endoprotease DegP-like n=1 Tax=Pseudahrensia aquimaris TaxID=744461 RepID=A0ABW3FDJ4_9HYPH
MPAKTSKFRNALLGSATAFGLATAFMAGGIVSPSTPAFAEAVRIEAPKVTNFADVVEAVSPAVVSVRVSGMSEQRQSRRNGQRGADPFGFDMLPEDHPFRRFFDQGPRGDRQFGQRRNRGGEQRRARPVSQGSGFFVSDDGYVVTNNHVVENGTGFTVVLSDGKEFEAKLIGTDPKTDLAVLKVEDSAKFTYVDFSTGLSRVGEWVVAVGNPFGLGGTVTAGIVSANSRDIGSGPYDDFIQIDAAVNKGNSGGPAFNLSGEVIGVNTAIFSPSGGNVGIAFAISAATAKEVVSDLIERGTVTRGWLGVQIQPVTKDIAESLGLADARGAIVSETQPNSPALTAGLKAGDVIVKVGDTDIEGPRELAKTIANLEPNETVDVAIYRDGDSRTVSVKLGELPEPERQAALSPSQAPDADRSTVDMDELGLAIVTTDEGVMVADVFENGSAAEKGMRAGDKIVSVNGRSVETVDDVGQAVARAMEDERKAVLFQVQSGERNRFVAIPVGRG